MRTTKRRLRGRTARAGIATIAGLLASLSLAGAAPAAEYGENYGVETFTARAVDLVDDGAGGLVLGDEVTQAGAHPDLLVVDIRIRGRNVSTGPLPQTIPDGTAKDIELELPPGIYGSAVATPRCPMSAFIDGRCAPQTAVGKHVLSYAAARGDDIQGSVVYNVVPPEGVVARFAFNVIAVDVVMDMKVNSDGRYTLQTNIRDISTALALLRSQTYLFGVPAALNGPGTLLGALGDLGGPGGGEQIPMLTLASQCGPALPVQLRTRSWERPETWVTAAYTPQDGISGCDRLTFEPDFAATPDSPRAGVPAGYEMRVTVPQNLRGDGLATPSVRTVSVTLPEGTAVSPSSAQGLVGCSDAQAALLSEAASSCPSASRIGSVQIDTPLLAGPLEGGVFLGTPLSMRSQTGEMLRLFLIAKGHGVTIKQEGRITPDPVTGQLHAVFDGAPQLPFSALTVRLDGGPTAPLTNPRTCGTHTTTSEITAWSGQVATTTDTFEITQDASGRACAPLGFAPSFVAGMGNASAGAASTFTLAFGRDDAQQDLGDLSVSLPAGMMGMVAASDLCDDASAAAGTCGESSRIGSVGTAVGAGQNPFQLSGRGVYLTGPYKGGPFGLSIVVPAVAGPFDLGTVVVRAAIHVDRRTAALSIVSDPFPTILEGIPLRMRQVTVAIDKPGFMVNPTSCSEKRIGGVLRSSTGTAANVGSRFQVGNCRALPYAPKLALQVGGRGRTRKGVTTPLTALLRMTDGQVNNRVVTVKLPRTLNSRMEVIRDACTLDQFEAGACDKNVGTATATTPVLRNPLTGTLQLVRNPARRLPDLMVRLRGAGREAGVTIDLTGKITIPRDLSLQTSFDTIPDVPIRSFRLNLVAGRRGAIGVTRNLCAAATRRGLVSQLSFRAQSGRLEQAGQRLNVAGCGARATAKKKALTKR
ncbi:hypothetical protein Q5424_02620 [Conexibacter sp. JD483]|uniref:hypothetical protein n=1 Tax=unclassified Conexibacter TaxID=2627773 RepID=UPI00271E4E06|nr:MULTISPECIES: hypothetical protein [unclassified Conexibacter]MDO8184048.1 hypothetical protein [Conexibacter sp. CPCC 205706]MDO8197040.1 hypothetical protein [Conexibacter sp. CPCC 205762]MDR9367956.1 hypothetical protein [Conexibacter sp. JD483]